MKFGSLIAASKMSDDDDDWLFLHFSSPILYLFILIRVYHSHLLGLKKSTKKPPSLDGSRLLVLYATDEIVINGTKDGPPTNDDACQHDAQSAMVVPPLVIVILSFDGLNGL